MKKKALLTIFTFLFIFSFTGTALAANSAVVTFSSNDQIVAGKNVTVEVFIDSNTEVNAAQIKILYPENKFTYLSTDSSNSKFSIKAEESQSQGSITVARGNIQALKGKELFTTIIFTAKKGASLSDLRYEPNDSLVMSKDNVNILTGSQVLTVKPVTPTPTPRRNSGFVNYFKQAVREFFRGLFGR